MAIVTRYFSTVSAGAGDGTSWANRAALATAGTISSLITAFDFTSDSLVALVGPGDYSINGSLDSFSTVAPNSLNALFFRACDASGIEWEPPDLNWCSAQPSWDISGMPSITCNDGFVNSNNINCYGLKVTGGRNGSLIDNCGYLRWCVLENTQAGTSARITASAIRFYNCVLKLSGTTFFGAVGSPQGNNVRCEGNPAATSGNRRGISQNTATFLQLDKWTFTGFLLGIFNDGVGPFVISRCALIDCETGIRMDSNQAGLIIDCVVVNNSGFGIVNAGSGQIVVENCRLRNNVSGNLDLTGNNPSFANYTDAGTDAAEFVDYASGDYRTKRTSAYWGLNIGAGDEPLDADDIAEYLWTNAGRTLT